MGHRERQRIQSTLDFVGQLYKAQLPIGCFQAALLAMGAKDIHLMDVMQLHENKMGIPNVDAYLQKQGLGIKASYALRDPIGIAEVNEFLAHPRAVLAGNPGYDGTKMEIAGTLFAFGGYEDNAPHVIGVLPRDQMSRNLRKTLKGSDSHLIVDTSLAGEPIYTMTTQEIAQNLNAFITHGVDTSLHIVTRAGR